MKVSECETAAALAPQGSVSGANGLIPYAARVLLHPPNGRYSLRKLLQNVALKCPEKAVDHQQGCGARGNSARTREKVSRISQISEIIIVLKQFERG